jgi:hypothetical protein
MGMFALKLQMRPKEGSCHLNNHHTHYSNVFATFVLLEGVNKLALWKVSIPTKAPTENMKVVN